MGELSIEKEKEIEELINSKKVSGNIFEDKNIIEEKEKSAAEIIVNKLLQQGIITRATEDDDTKAKILENARQSIGLEISKIINRGKKEAQDTAYDANKEACKYYGVADSVETWKIKMMKAGAAFWFVIWFLISSITFTPITVLTDKIHNFIKWYWLSLIIALLIFVFAIIGIPLLINNNII